MSRAKRLGTEGETLARAYLEGLGWRILKTNFRTPFGEIDIVAEEGEGEARTLVFVEVKARRNRSHGSGLEAITPRKQERIILAAQAFLAECGETEEPAYRYDALEIYADADGLFRVFLHRGLFG